MHSLTLSGTVLVIENGFMVDDVTTQVPSFANSINSALMYDITSAYDTNTGGTHPVWVGNVVGGGSVVNGMAFDRASAADYNAYPDRVCAACVSIVCRRDVVH